MWGRPLLGYVHQVYLSQSLHARPTFLVSIRVSACGLGHLNDHTATRTDGSLPTLHDACVPPAPVVIVCDSSRDISNLLPRSHSPSLHLTCVDFRSELTPSPLSILPWLLVPSFVSPPTVDLALDSLPGRKGGPLRWSSIYRRYGLRARPSVRTSVVPYPPSPRRSLSGLSLLVTFYSA